VHVGGAGRAVRHGLRVGAHALADGFEELAAVATLRVDRTTTLPVRGYACTCRTPSDGAGGVLDGHGERRDVPQAGWRTGRGRRRRRGP
jgi:hypothetical protein